MKIPFSPPDISELEIEEVANALRSGWITTGPKTKELERKIAQYCGVNKAVCLNSQTACAEMALRLLDIGAGDEVITSAYTYTASASIVCHVGAKLVLVDTQKDSYEMDYQKLENAITAKTKAIIPVDIGGVPCDYQKIFEIVERKRGLFTPSENAIQKALGRVVMIGIGNGIEDTAQKSDQAAGQSRRHSQDQGVLDAGDIGAGIIGPELTDVGYELCKLIHEA